jgi:putative sterol carrier protein
MPGPSSLDEAVEWLRKNFRSEAADGIEVSYGIDLRGPGGGQLAVAIAGGAVTVARGPARAADVKLRLAAQDYFAVLGGSENADLLYMAGRLEIDGDLSLAIKLRTLFRPRA